MSRDLPTTFTILEGIDGSGKTSAATAIADNLRAEGRDVLVVRAPGETAVGQKIRAIVVENPRLIADPYTRQLLFIADHRELYTQVILPALYRGVSVVCDRFIESTYSYAVGGLGLDPIYINTLIGLIFAEAPSCPVVPHTLWFHLPISEALHRLGKRTQDASDRLYMDKFQRIQDTYEARWRAADQDRSGPVWTPIYAHNTPERVLDDCLDAVYGAA